VNDRQVEVATRWNAFENGASTGSGRAGTAPGKKGSRGY